MNLNLTVATLLAAGVAAAQTAPTHPPIHHTSAGACAKLPELSSKIPALPAGTPCARHLYTIAVKANADLEYVAPLANSSELRETLHLQEPSSFSLDYIDLKSGTGLVAAPHKWLTVKYSGYLTDGTRFDSSEDHPAGDPPFAFQYGQIGGPGSAVPGWETGFEGMHVGARRRLLIPYQLAYGAGPHGPKIPAKSMLIFDVELVAVADKDPNPSRPAPPSRPGMPSGRPPMPPSQQAPPTQSAPAPAPPAATPPAPATPPPATTTPKP